MGWAEKTTIGGVSFLIEGEGRIGFFPEHPFYDDFCESSFFEESKFEVKLETKIESRFEPAPGSEMFRHGNLWRILQDGSDRHIQVFSRVGGDILSYQLSLSPDNLKAVLQMHPDCLPENGDFSFFWHPYDCPIDHFFLIYNFANSGRAMVHAVSAEVQGKGVLFLGKSGVGKSTLAKQMHLSGTGTVINDERAIVHLAPDGFDIYGTPYLNDLGVARNEKAPLSGLYFLQQDAQDCIEELRPAVALTKLLTVSSVPWFDKDYMDPILATLEKMVTTVPAYLLRCKKGQGVVDLIQQHVSGFEKVPA